MTKRRWVYKPTKPSKPTVPENEQSAMQERCDRFIATILFPKYITSVQIATQEDCLVNLSGYWYRNYFYFISHYEAHQLNAILPAYDSKFARLEYIKHNTFHLSYMRHTGEWWELSRNISLNQCCDAIASMPHFLP